MAVLVAVAADQVQDAVLDAAIEVGNAFDEELYVVHLTDGTEANATERQVRNDIQARLEEQNVSYSVSLEYANRSGTRSGAAVGQQLADIATDVDISRIVVGHREKGLSRRLVDGNSAFAAAEAANVPVTIVPAPE
ncbi:MAG: universal stress protein [Halovenus sp.]